MHRAWFSMPPAGRRRRWTLTAGRLALLAVLMPAACLSSCERGEGAARADFERRLQQLREQRQRLDETVWADEIRALEHERALVGLWDALKDADDKLAALGGATFERLRIGPETGRVEHDHGIRTITYGPPSDDAGRTWDPQRWRQTMADLSAEGYRLVMSDWHHVDFDAEADPTVSTVRANLYAMNVGRREMAAIHATLRIRWSGQRDGRGAPIAGGVTVTDARVMKRSGDPAFTAVHRIDPTAAAGTPMGAEPILLYDLDGDGLSEVILAGANRVFWNRGGGAFRAEPLLGQTWWDPRRVTVRASVIADFTGDGLADFLCAAPMEGQWDRGQLVLYRGDTGGRFSEAPIIVSRPDQRLINPEVLTAGDIDDDGDLDLWVAQYRSAYRDGNMATPYYDANDGFPSYLLRNDGEGRFTDVTERAGLAPKRHRRTYSASFVDLDDDGDLDLLVVSDYAGVDVYHNDGAGRFTDVTERILPERRLFGMAHTFDDFNLDGRLDVYAIGMTSATATRLDNMGLGRDDRPLYHEMRPKMHYGNRMYLGAADGRFTTPPYADRVARTGWSWGATSLDFDNDGDRDIYVANGHISGRSTEDYCSVFWRHDIYTGDSDDDPAANELFLRSMADVMNRRQSWDGYQKNVLWMNEDGPPAATSGGGRGFINVAFLMGAAFDYDARAVVADDLDADGRVDLLVVHEAGPDQGQIVHLVRNRFEGGNWIGVRLREHGGGHSPVGARVDLHTPAGKRTAWLVTGDSFSSRHADVAHFGLGDAASVDAVEVRWPNGRTTRLENPAVNRYHQIAPDTTSAGEASDDVASVR